MSAAPQNTLGRPQEWPTSAGRYGRSGWTFDRAIEAVGEGNPNLVMGYYVVAWGRAGTPDAPPHPIEFPIRSKMRFAYSPPTQAVTISDPEGSAASTWFEVRWWPFIDAPNLPYLVDGESLADVIRLHVFGDVEYEKAISRAAEILPELQDFRHWLSTAYQHDYSIRMHTGDKLRPDPLVRWMDLWPGEVKSKKRVPAGTSDFAYVLDEKLYGLFDRLISGEIHADAISSRDGARRTIEPLHWKRRDTVLDLLTGDIYDARIDEIEWRDVVLRAPPSEAEPTTEPQAVVSEPKSARPKGSTNGTMVEAVGDVFLTQSPDDTPSGMARKESDPIIREHLGYPRDGTTPSDRTITAGITLARAEIAKRRS